ncbi:hypothetical protein, partial [Hymenobacter saemangeumensis]|uniref:hypothetical protein n=1 Tax=Hymenobacter saemangeumensis TaxID=1084522 RepID=UPI0031E5AA7A
KNEVGRTPNFASSWKSFLLAPYFLNSFTASNVPTQGASKLLLRPESLRNPSMNQSLRNR